MNEVLLAFLQHAQQHYRGADGRTTDELENMRDAIRPLKELYGTLPAAEFSPLKLKALRQRLLASRRYFAVHGQDRGGNEDPGTVGMGTRLSTKARRL